MLAYALLRWLQIHTPKESVWHQVYMLFIYVGVMCSIIHYGSKAIKKHITYPRTGFVQYPKRNSLWAMAAGAFVASATVAFIVTLRPDGSAIVEWLFGPLMAGGYAYGVARVWLVRWKWIVVSAMVFASLVIAKLPATALGPLWLTMAVYGALFMVSGAATLILYLRHTKAPVQDAQ